MLLPDEAIVVRGGTCKGSQLFNGCGDHAGYPGMYGFSVQSHPGKSVNELARAGEFPNGRIGASTVGAIRKAGYDVVETPGRGYHATIVVPKAWTQTDADSLAQNFIVQSNPAQR